MIVLNCTVTSFHSDANSVVQVGDLTGTSYQGGTEKCVSSSSIVEAVDCSRYARVVLKAAIGRWKLFIFDIVQGSDSNIPSD